MFLVFYVLNLRSLLLKVPSTLFLNTWASFCSYAEYLKSMKFTNQIYHIQF